MCTSLSAYWQGEHGVVDAVPKFKSGNTLDFFRSEPGSLFVPAILDDGNMASEDHRRDEGVLRCGWRG